MRCSHCGICCEKTEMLLSNADIERLERVGHNRQEFVRYDGLGFARLRNHNGFCVFYDAAKRRCEVYRHRPLGCWVYPVICKEQEGIAVDDLCPMKNTVSKLELKRKGERVIELLHRIDEEAILHRNVHI